MAKPVHYYGHHACLATIEKRPEDVLQVFVLDTREDDRINQLIDVAKQFGLSVQPCKKVKLEKLANSTQHQGVVIQCRPIHVYSEKDVEDLLLSPQKDSMPPLFLALDQITDPHNLGACLRSAEAMGVNGVISSKKNSCSLTPTAVKISAGSAEMVPFVSVGSLANTLQSLKQAGVHIYGTMLDDTAISIQKCNFSMASVIVMGAEDVGLRQKTQGVCSQLCYIPMLGSVQSLNVSVATGMALYEARRQVSN